MICRFILDLRGVYYSPERTHDLASTINFATGTIAGNLGAPLRTDSTWISGPIEADVDDESSIEISKGPFIVGLSPTVVELEMESTRSPVVPM